MPPSLLGGLPDPSLPSRRASRPILTLSTISALQNGLLTLPGSSEGPSDALQLSGRDSRPHLALVRVPPDLSWPSRLSQPFIRAYRPLQTL